MTNLTHKALQVFAGDRYATESTGIVLDLVESQHACCSLTVTPTLCNAMGAVMGGAMFTLADLAFAAAANADDVAADRPISWVSLSSNIHYIAQPKSSRILAEANCVRQGRSICVYNIQLTDDLHNPVALVSTTGMKIK